MKPVFMLKATEASDGDCLNACVASILEIDITELADVPEGPEWFRVLLASLALRGFTVVELWGDDLLADDRRSYPAISPPGYAIAVGPSPRNEGHHAVVSQDGLIVHDPHPNGTGIVRVDYWLMLVPVQRGPRLLSPLAYDEAVREQTSAAAGSL
jgi:hypothetical protein